MKTVLFFSFATAAVFGVAWWLQDRQLEDLRSYSGVIAKENRTLTESSGGASGGEGARSTVAPTEGLDPVVVASELLDGIVEIASASASGNEEPELRRKMFDLMERVGAARPETLEAMLDQLDGRGLDPQASGEIGAMLLGTLGKHDPRSALALALERETRSASDDLRPEGEGFKLALLQWIEKDADAAVAWIMAARRDGRIPADAEGLNHIADMAIAVGLSKRTPVAALERASATTDSSERFRILKVAAENLTDPEDWLTFARQAAASEDPGFRAKALTTLNNESLHNAGIGDLRPLVEQLDLPPEDLNRFVRSAATFRIDGKTAERADWMIGRSHPDHLHDNVDRLVTLWTSNDFNGAAAWLQGLDPSPVRDTAVATFSVQVAEREPETAADWAMTIQDEKKRREAVESIVGSWEKVAPGAAAAYLGAPSSGSDDR